MRVIEILYPDALTAVSELSYEDEDCEHEAKTALGAKLCEMGRLTLGQATRLAGVSRVKFLLECHRFDLPSVA